MALSYKARRRWALVILLIGMPLYVVAAVTLVGLIERPSFLVELLIYVGLGFLWAVPFRFIFRGIGQADPDAPVPADERPANERPANEKPANEKPANEKPVNEKTDGQGPSV